MTPPTKPFSSEFYNNIVGITDKNEVSKPNKSITSTATMKTNVNSWNFHLNITTRVLTWKLDGKKRGEECLLLEVIIHER